MDKVKGSLVTTSEKSPPPKRARVCRIGHHQQVNLAEQIKKPRQLMKLKGDQVMWTNLPDGGHTKTSMDKLEEDFAPTEVGAHLQQGGWLPVPVANYIKSGHKMVSVETEENMKKELMLMYNELIAEGGGHQFVNWAGKLGQAGPANLLLPHV